MRLIGKIALVTGGGGFVGTATCERLAEEGSFVAVNDIAGEKAEETVRKIEERGGQAETSVFDVTLLPDVQKAIDRLVERHKRIDILVNVAGGPKNVLVTDMTEEEWNYANDLNLKGTFHCIRAATRHMIAQKSGKIVCTSSTAKYGVPWFFHIGQSNYAAANAGLIGLTRALTYELAPFGININCVVPGPIETPKSKPMFEKLEHDQRVKVSPLRAIPLGRLAKPVDVANGIVFLVSSEADYITGTVLNISGGLFG